jgi:hypothetical protein
MSVKKLQVSQDDFRDEILREISQMNDEMQQLKLSNCQKIDSLPIRMNSNAATNNTNSDLARQKSGNTGAHANGISMPIPGNQELA